MLYLRKQKEKLQAALAKAEQEKADAVKQLKTEEQSVREQAVEKARLEEREHASAEMLKLGLEHENYSAELYASIYKLQKDLEHVRRELSSTTNHKENIISEFTETREEFQKFIDHTRPFHISESKYVLPNAKSIDLS